MANSQIPEYQERVGVEAPGRMDTTSGDIPTPSYAQAGLSVVDKFLNNELTSKMGEMGTKAAEQQGAQLKTLPELTPAMAAFNKAALPIASQSALTGLTNQAQGWYNNLLANGLTPDSAESFKTQMAAGIKAYADTLDPKLQQTFGRSSAMVGQSYLNKVNSQLQTLQTNQGIFSFRTTAGHTETHTSELARAVGLDALTGKTQAGKAALLSHSNEINQNSSAWATLHITPDQRFKLNSQANASLVANAYIGQAQNIVKVALENKSQNVSPLPEIARLNALAANVAQNPDVGKFNLSPADVASTEKQIQEQVKVLKQSLFLQQGTEAEQYNNLVAQIHQNTPVTSNQMLAMMQFKDGEQKVDNLTAMQHAGNIVSTQLQHISPGGLVALKAQYDSGNYSTLFDKKHQDSISPLAQQAGAQLASKMIGNQLHLLNSHEYYDAVHHTIPSQILADSLAKVPTGGSRAELLDVEHNPQNLLSNNLSDQAKNGWRQQQLIINRQAQSMGISSESLGAFSSVHAGQLSTMINNASIQDKQNYMTNLAANSGPYFNQALLALQKNGLRADTASIAYGAANGVSGPVTNELYKSIDYQTKENNKIKDKNNPLNLGAFKTAMKAYTGGLTDNQLAIQKMLSPQQQQSQQKLMYDLWYIRMSNHDPKTDPTQLFNDITPYKTIPTVANQLLLPKYVTQTNGHNQQVQVPVNPESERTIANNLYIAAHTTNYNTLDLSKIKANYPAYTDKELQNLISTTALWQPNASHTGAYLALNGQPLVTKKGNRYGFNYGSGLTGTGGTIGK